MDKPTLIHKVLAGQANDAEKAELSAWIASDPSNAEEFEDIKLLHDSTLDIEQKIMDRDDQFYDGLRKIQERIKALKRRRGRARLYKTAAVVVILSTAVMMVSVYYFQGSTPSRAVQKPLNGKDKVMSSDALLNNNLIFEDATLESIFDMLNDKYDVSFEIRSNEILSCRFTGTFSRGITMDEMLHTLAQSGNFSYTVLNPKRYELQGNGCL